MNMKKSYYYVVAAMFMTMSFSGCSSDEDVVNDPEPEVVRPDDNKTAQDEGKNNDNPNGDTTDPNTGSVVACAYPAVPSPAT